MASAREKQATAGAARRVPVYQVLTEDLIGLGIEAVFGLMSDDTAVFAATLDASGVAFHGARHENTAIGMAEGYAAATGRLGVAVVGRGPATANGLHAAVFSTRTSSKVLIIYGEAPVQGGELNVMGPDYKGFDAQSVLRSAGIRTFTATSSHAARPALADAVAAAEQGNAVALLLPTNVQLAEIEIPDEAPSPFASSPPRVPAPARPAAVEAAAALLEASRRPVIVAGYGAHLSGARAALEALAERSGALLVTSARAKDLFRGHPLALGVLGSFSHSIARRMIDEADCVMVFGAGLNFLTMSFGASLPKVPLIHVDAARASIGRWHDADVAMVGDARVVAEQLAARLPERAAGDKPFHAEAVRREIAAFDPADDFEPANTARTVDPRSLGIALDRLLPADRSMVYDGGNFLGVVPYLSVPGPARFKMTNVFASIGLGFGAALGFAKAHPESTTVLVVGDGGFTMTMGELETAVREDLPLVIVLMNDCAYGAELHFLRMRQLPVTKSVFPDVDYAPIAEAFGYQAATVRTLADLEALAPLLAKPEGPIFLDCKINADVAAPFMSEFAQFESSHED